MCQRCHILDTDATVDSDVQRSPGSHLPQPADSLEGFRDEFLSTESRIDRHDENKIGPGQGVPEQRQGGRRVDCDSGLHSTGPDMTQRALEVIADLHVNRNPGHWSSDELVDEWVGFGHHQVCVEGDLRSPRDVANHEGAEGEVGYEVAVHDIEMQQIRTSPLDLSHLVSEVGEIGREKRRCQSNVHRLTHTVMISDGATGDPAGGYWRSTRPEGTPG